RRERREPFGRHPGQRFRRRVVDPVPRGGCARRPPGHAVRVVRVPPGTRLNRAPRPIPSPARGGRVPAPAPPRAMRNAFARVGIEDVSAETMAETKARIVEAIAAVASGALLDHEAARRRPDGLGALVPLEKQGYTTINGGRLTELEFTAEDALAA